MFLHVIYSVAREAIKLSLSLAQVVENLNGSYTITINIGT